MAYGSFFNIAPDDHAGVVRGGFPLYFQEKYNEAVRKAAWFAYDGMWRAAASGIGKGVIAAVATVMTAAVAIGSLTIGPTLAYGAVEGLTNGLAILSSATTALPIIAVGAAIGAVYDVSVRQSGVQKELAEIRQEMRNYKGMEREYELDKDPNRVPGEGIERPVYYNHSHGHQHEVVPEQVATDYWQNRVATDKNNPGARGLS